MWNRYLILGLLIEAPMTGYTIKKRVCETMHMIASPSYGAVYPTLHRLLEEGAVTVSEVPQEGRPDKKVYAITAQGQDAFEAWLREPAGSDQVKREFLLKVLLSHNLETEVLADHLERRRAETEALQARLLQLHAQPRKQVNGHHSHIIAYALRLCEAELHWLEQMEASLPVEESLGPEPATQT
jgi:DNA-binding PadR family transcriptional regulator